VAVLHQAVPGVNFVGTRVYAVSGKITTSAGAAVAGATISGGGQSFATTDATGAYRFVAPAGTYTLTPSLTNFEFTPATLSVNVTSADLVDRNFTGRDVVTKVDCAVSAWNAWGTCEGTCGGYPGTQARTRTIVAQPQNGGLACPTLQETQSCTTGPCPVACQVSGWSAWGSCSSLCNGQQARSRTITVAPAYGGTRCPSLSESQACNVYSSCGRVRFVLFRCADAIKGGRVAVNGQVLGNFSAGPFSSGGVWLPYPYYSPYYVVPAGVAFTLQAWFTYSIGSPVSAYYNPAYRADTYPHCAGNSCVVDSDIALCSTP
jgi:hypothetical protein